jgi:hypothetical protein
MVNLLPFFEWCEATWLGAAVRDSVWLFPVVECVHLIALAWVAGAILVVDLRLLGFGFARQPVAAIAAGARRWLVTGLVVLVATGVLLFVSEAVECYENPMFWTKMALLAISLAVTFALRDRVCRAGDGTRLSQWGRPVAVLSLALWLGVALSGRAIGFY